MSLTQEQIENIQIDYGLVFVNYGETGQKKLGPTRGGGEFTATRELRDIEFDGKKGKTKGMQVIDTIDAMLKVVVLDTTIETLSLSMPYATLAGDKQSLTCGTGAIGVVKGSDYLKNIVMFAKTIAGTYKKITLYNAMSESDFSLKAAPKGEGEVGLEVYAHWNELDDTDNLYKIENVASISEDKVAPTVVTVPVDGATTVVKSSSLTATFDKEINVSDVNSDNFILIEALDGTIVAGALSYVAGTKTATFAPTTAMSATTDYIWLISGVRDTAFNKMVAVVVNFKTVA